MSDILINGSRNATKFLLEELVVFGGFLKESVKGCKSWAEKIQGQTYIIHHVYIISIYIYIYIYTRGLYYTYNPMRRHNTSTSGWKNAMSKEAKHKLLQVPRN